MENTIERQNVILENAIDNIEEDPHWIIWRFINDSINAWKKKAEELLTSIKDELSENEEEVKAAKTRYMYKREKIKEEIAFIKEKCESCDNFLKEYEKNVGANANADVDFFDFAEANLTTANEIKIMVQQCKAHFEAELNALELRYRETEEEEKRVCEEIRNSLHNIEVKRQANYCLEQAKKLESWLKRGDEYDEYYYDDYDDSNDDDDC